MTLIINLSDVTCSVNMSLTFINIIKDIEVKLQKIADHIYKTDRIIVFVNAEISTKCDISVSTNLHSMSSLNNNILELLI